MSSNHVFLNRRLTPMLSLLVVLLVPTISSFTTVTKQPLHHHPQQRQQQQHQRRWNIIHSSTGKQSSLTMANSDTTNDDDNESPPPSSPPKKSLPLTAMEKAEGLRKQARKMRLEADRQTAQLTLEKIQKLELALAATTTTTTSTNNKNNNNRKELKEQIERLVQEVDPTILPSLSDNIKSIAASSTITSSTTTTAGTSSTVLAKTTGPPREPVLTSEELQSATDYYQSLPIALRRALAKVVELEYDDVSPSIVVLGLYEGGERIEGSTVRELYEQCRVEASTGTSGNSNGRVVASITTSKGESDNKNDPSPLVQFAKVMDPNVDTTGLESMVESILPRVTRKPDQGPTLQDLSILTTKILGKNTFQSNGPPEVIPGGFLIRGFLSPKLRKNQVVTGAANNDSRGAVEEGKGGGSEVPPATSGGTELIRLIDESLDELDPSFNEKFQVCYIYDPTPVALEENGSDNPVLVITGRDLAPTTNRFLSSGVTSLSFFLALIFAVSTWGANDVVMDRLTEANALATNAARDGISGVNVDVNWFNELLTPLLIAIGAPQLASELSHLLFAKRGGFKTTPPTVLPLLALPYLSFQTSLKTSPKDPSSLFNYAFAGPAAGMLTSAVFFAVGMQLTLTMTPAALEYAPSVPVAFLKLSSLFGTIVDYTLSGGNGLGVGGGDGVILSQDPNTSIPLHPFAIGGMTAFMIQSLDTIPIGGSTDGGRMSQALLGRKEHLGFSAVVYGALLVFVLFSGHREIFLSYLFTMGLVQKDGAEIMCRNEVDKAGLVRASGALVMWSLAFLALTPIN